LVNEVKTLNEILNILTEEWRQCKVTDEVRNDEQHVDKVKVKEKHLISCNCDTLKTQCLELQKEINSVSSRVKSTKKDIESIKQVNNINLSSNDLLTTKYSVSTANRFAILSKHSDTLSDGTTYTQYQDSSLGDPTKINKYQGRSVNQRKRISTRTIPNSLYFNNNKHDQQVNEKNENAGNYIPTIVNGAISNSFSFKSTTENSVVSDVNGDCVHAVVAELRETMQVHLQKDNPSMEHKIILIGDSNMRGYVSTLQTLLDSNYKLYSIVKPGSDTNELLNTAKETSKKLTQKDIIVLCYGTNDFNQRTSGKNYPNTFQNIKKFITSNSHTNILVINIPVRYDLNNNGVMNKTISKLNVKLQKLVKINPYSKFLETPKDINLYTKHGLHFNKKGKYLTNLKIASLLLSILAHNTKKPIVLNWYDPSTDNQNNMKINAATNVNRNSGRNRKVPVTRTDDFLWPK